ncbi:MAG: 2-phosphosulfolactate phosphatase [Flammeovirgaceae bacterium]|nr:2-phosphosulfolactate phosphatase [Flammeovirgaceae bacterium]|tara:strand:- start:5462 stop:6169 length:708 start_codon:yes stop_codon:yes gene_type:complete
MNHIEVCLTPELIHQFELKDKIVVAVDIFRATSCMVTGMAHGISAIYPVADVEQCFKLGKEEGMITAGERGGQKIDGFTIGNSPYEYMKDEFQSKSIVVTTTNGTKTILASLEADQILIGAFLNLQAIADYISSSHKDVIIHCAGWKGTVNVEDTLFAGALIEEVKASHIISGDPALMAQQLFKSNSHDLLAIAEQSSHAKRLATFGIGKDIEFCMNQSLYSVVPEFREGRLQVI